MYSWAYPTFVPGGQFILLSTITMSDMIAGRGMKAKLVRTSDLLESPLTRGRHLVECFINGAGPDDESTGFMPVSYTHLDVYKRQERPQLHLN